MENNFWQTSQKCKQYCLRHIWAKQDKNALFDVSVDNTNWMFITSEENEENIPNPMTWTQNVLTEFKFLKSNVKMSYIS